MYHHGEPTVQLDTTCIQAYTTRADPIPNTRPPHIRKGRAQTFIPFSSTFLPFSSYTITLKAS
jgi:hypothetical protein